MRKFLYYVITSRIITVTKSRTVVNVGRDTFLEDDEYKQNTRW